MSTTPVYVADDELRLAQSNFIQDAGADIGLVDFGGGFGSPDSNSDFSGGSGRIFSSNGEFGEWQLGELNYTLPEGDVDVAVRLEADSGTQATVEATLIRDGSMVGSVELWNDGGGGVGTPIWFNKDGAPDNVIAVPEVGFEWTDGDLEPGNYNIRIECTESGDNVFIDLVSIRDERFGYAFDDTVHEPDGYLDGPELFPDVAEFDVGTTTRRDVTEATLESVWDDTTNNQFVEARIGQDAFTREDNSTSVSVTASEPARSIDARFGLSRYPEDTDPQDATPRFGYNGQSIDSYQLRANPDAIFPRSLGTAEVDAVVPQGSIVGDRIQEAGQLTDSDALLTRSIMAPFDVFERQEIRSSEKVSFDNS